MQNESLLKAKELKYLTGVSKMDREIGRCVGASSISGDAGVVPDKCGEEGAEPEGKASD